MIGLGAGSCRSNQRGGVFRTTVRRRFRSLPQVGLLRGHHFTGDASDVALKGRL